VSEPRRPTRRDLVDPVMLLALGFGSGLSPRAPGTAGSLVGLVVYLLVAPMPLIGQLTVIATAIGLGVPICGYAAGRLGQHDHPAIVWDELACVPLAMVLLPAQIGWLAAGWLAFRLFDAIKPWPISALDRRIRGGLGIMADDIAAACAAALGVMAAHAAWVAV